MNLASEMHRLTGRMRKARRRGRRHEIRIVLLWFLGSACFFASAFVPQRYGWPLPILGISSILSGQRKERRARLYESVVDRCQGAMLLLLRIQGSAIDRAVLLRAADPNDKRRWS